MPDKIKAFIKDGVETMGGSYSEELGNDILNKYEHDYDKVVNDFSAEFGIPEDKRETFRNDIYKKYSITPLDEEVRGERVFVNKPIEFSEDTHGWEAYDKLEEDLGMAEDLIQKLGSAEVSRIDDIQKGTAPTAAPTEKVKVGDMQFDIPLPGQPVSSDATNIPPAQIAPSEAYEQRRAPIEEKKAATLEKLKEIAEKNREQYGARNSTEQFLIEEGDRIDSEIEATIKIANDKYNEYGFHKLKTDIPSSMERQVMSQHSKKLKSLEDLKALNKKMVKESLLTDSKGLDAVWTGFSKNAFTKDFLTLGVSEMGRDFKVIKAMEALDELKADIKTNNPDIDDEILHMTAITQLPSEQHALVEAYTDMLLLQQASRKGTAANVGEQMQAMIPFIVEFAATQGAATGAKKGTQAIIKKIIRDKVKAKVAGNIAGAIVKPAVQTGLSQLSINKGAAKEMLPTLGEGRNLEKGKEFGEAYWTATLNQAAEIVGENAASWAQPKMRSMILKGLETNPGKAQELLSKLALKVTPETGVPTIQGAPFEMLGEEITGATQAFIANDDSFFTPEAQKELAILIFATSGIGAAMSTPKRLAVGNSHRNAEAQLDDIPNQQYTDAVREATETFTDPYELNEAFKDINKSFGQQINKKEFLAADNYINKTIQLNSMSNARVNGIAAKIAQFKGSDGNVTMTNIDGIDYTIKNVEKLGQPNEIIYAKAQDGTITPIQSAKIKEWETRSPEQIIEETIASEDAMDEEYAATEQTLQKAAERNITEGKRVETEAGSGVVRAINNDNTVTIQPDKGEMLTVSLDEFPVMEVAEETQAEEEQPAMEVVSDEVITLPDNTEVQVQEFENGSSVAYFPEGEQVFKTPEERDALFKELLAQEVAEPTIDEMSAKESYDNLMETKGEAIALEIAKDDIKQLKAEARKMRTNTKGLTRTQKVEALEKASEIEAEAAELEEYIKKPQQQKMINEAEALYQEYKTETANTPLNSLLDWQRDLLSYKFHRDSFARFGDNNNITQSFARNWLAPKKEGKIPSNSIDTIAQELSEIHGVEITPDMIVEFATENPTPPRSTSDRQKEIATEYKKITGNTITKHEELIAESGIEPNIEAKAEYDPRVEAYNERKAELEAAKVPDEQMTSILESEFPETKQEEVSNEQAEQPGEEETTITEEDEAPFRVAPEEGVEVEDMSTKEPTKGTILDVSEKAAEDLKTSQKVIPELESVQRKYGVPIRIINSSEMSMGAKRKAAKTGILGMKKYLEAKYNKPIADIKPKHLTEQEFNEAVRLAIPYGYYQSGNAFIFSDKIDSLAEAKKTYLHEAVLHKGLDVLFNDNKPVKLGENTYETKDELLLDVYGRMGMDITKSRMKGYAPDVYNEYFDNNGNLKEGMDLNNLSDDLKLELAEEALGHLNEYERVPNVLQKLLDAIYKFFKNANKFTQNQFAKRDLFKILEEHRKLVKEAEVGDVIKGIDDPRFMMAKHGSKHLFDRFEMSNIGEGIGAQVYGHGLYFTDLEDIALEYAKLGEEGSRHLYDVKIHGDKTLEELNFLDDRKGAVVSPEMMNTIVTALNEKGFTIDGNPIQDETKLNDLYNKYDGYSNLSKEAKAGNEQAIKDLAEAKEIRKSTIQGSKGGLKVYKKVAKAVGGEKAASEFLLKNGIDGLVYEEQTSDGKSKGNGYVVYDDKAIDIENTAKFRVDESTNDNYMKLASEENTSEAYKLVEETAKKWGNTDEILSGYQIGDIKTGEPFVANVFHATTHPFNVFKGSEKGNVEGHLGATNYFTSEQSDAETNYQGDGADLTSRIEQGKEQIDHELEYDLGINPEPDYKISDLMDDEKESVENRYSITLDKHSERPLDELSRIIAESELKGSDERVLDLFVKAENPIVLGKESVYIEAIDESYLDDYMEEATEAIMEEYEIDEAEAKEDYEYDIKAKAQELAQENYVEPDNKLTEAFDKAMYDNGVSGELEADQVFGELLYKSEVDLNQVEQSLRGSENLAYLYTDEVELINSQIINDFFVNLGYDAIILNNVAERFPNMGLYDGVSHIHITDDYNNKIKSADPITYDDNGDIIPLSERFDEKSDIRFRVEETDKKLAEKNLVAMHNLTAENLIHADKMGGLPVPSIAIARTDKGFGAFGDISLLADKSMIDPQDRDAKTFNADIYSPRYPSINYDVNYKTFDNIFKEANDIASKHDIPTVSIGSLDLENDGIRALKDDHAVYIAYLLETGTVPRPIMREVDIDPSLHKYIKKGWVDTNALIQDEQFIEDITKVFKKKDEERGRERYVRDGVVNENLLYKEASKIARANAIKEPDTYASRDAIRNKAVGSSKKRKEFDSWLQDKWDSMVDKERIFKGLTPSGDHKYTPHTLDNVVKKLKQGLQGEEGSFYGVGSVRSGAAKQFKSIEDIQADRDKIVDEETMKQIKEEVDAEFQDILETVKPYYKFDTEGWGYSSGAGESLVEYAKKGRSSAFNAFPKDVKEEVDTFLSKLRNMPTEYFESKIQRAVGLNEFKAAVIPNNTPQQAIDVLEANNIAIKKYNPKKEGDRIKKLELTARQQDVKFRVADSQQELEDFVKDSKVKETVYHGGADEIVDFSEDFAGLTTADNEHGAFYFSNIHDIADDYANAAFVRRYQDNPEGLVDDDILSQEQYDKLEDEDVDWYEYVEELAEERKNIVSAKINMKNPLIVDAQYQNLRELEQSFNIQDAIGYLKGKGTETPEMMLDEMQFNQDDVDNYKEEIEERAIEENELESPDEIEDWMMEEATREVLYENEIYEEAPEYDGIIIKNVIDDIGDKSSVYQDVHIAISNDQILIEPTESKQSQETKFRMIEKNPDFSKEKEKYRGGNYEIKDGEVYTTLYDTRFDEPTATEFISSSIDINNAIDEADSSDYDYDYTGANIGIGATDVKIPVSEIMEDIGAIEEMDEPDFDVNDWITDTEIEDFLKNNNAYEYTTNEEYYTTHESQPDNKATDELIWETQDELSKRFDSKVGKYSSVYMDKEGNITGEIEDESGSENREISIRIADHTHNPANGKNDVTIVIANKDATENRFYTANTDLVFDEDYSVADIADEIEQYIKDNFSYDDVRFRVDEARQETNTNPTEAQKEAGNYKMGHVKFDGFDISIENPKGTTRSGVNEQGEEWSNEMPADYGYFKGTVGKDKDHIDLFLGDKLDSDKVYVVDQINPETGAFDEHKVMMGYDNISAARKAYNAAYDEDWKGLGDITRTTKDNLKEWFKSGNTKAPFKQEEVRFKVGDTDEELMNLKEKLQEQSKVNKRIEEARAELGKDKQAISEMVKILKEGARLGKSDTKAGIKEMQKMIVDYANKAITYKAANANEIKPILTMIKNTQEPTVKGLETRFNKIADIATKIDERQERNKSMASINRLLKFMTKGKKVGMQTKGKFNIEDVRQFKELDSINKESSTLSKTTRSNKLTDEEKALANTRLDEMWNELDEREDKTLVDNTMQQIIEMRRNGNEASTQLLKAIQENLSTLYAAAKEAKSEADFIDRLAVSKDRELTKSTLRSVSDIKNWTEGQKIASYAIMNDMKATITGDNVTFENKDGHGETITKEEAVKRATDEIAKGKKFDEKKFFERLATDLNTFTGNAMGNWETLLTMIGGKKLRDEFSLILNQVDQDVNTQETFDSVFDTALDGYGFKDRKELMKYLQDSNKEEYELPKAITGNKRVEGAPLKISKMQLIDIYNAIKNKDVRNDYFTSYGDLVKDSEGNYDRAEQRNIGEQRINELLGNLSEGDKIFADAMQVAADGYFDKINDVFIKTHNRDLPKVENYWPSSALINEADLSDQGRMMIESKHPSSTKERASHRTPKPVDAYEKFAKHINQGEWYNNMAMPLDRMTKVFKDNSVKALIEESRGEKFYNEVIHHLDNQGLTPQRSKKTAIEEKADWLLNNWVAAKIGLTPSVPLKQLLSMVNYTENMPTGEWAAGLAKALANPKETIQEMMDIPYIKQRVGKGYSEVLERSLKQDNFSTAGNIHQQIKNLETIGTRYGDLAAIAFGGKPYLDYLQEKKGLSKEEAVDQFLLDTLRSQQSPFSSTLSSWQNDKNVIKRAMFTFSNTPSQYMRKMFEAQQMYRHGDISKAQLANAYYIYGVLSNISYVVAGSLISAAMTGSDPWEDIYQKLAAQGVVSLVGGLPVIKDIADTAARTAFDMKIYEDVNPIVGGLETGLTEIARGMRSDKEETRQKATWRGAKALMESLGLSAHNAEKTYKAIFERQSTIQKRQAKDGNQDINDAVKEYRDINKSIEDKSTFYQNRVKKSPEYKELELANDIKTLYSKANKKAKSYKENGKDAKAEEIEKSIERSQASIKKNGITPYEYTKAERTLKRYAK